MSADEASPRVDPALALVATSSPRLPDAPAILAACGLKGRNGGLLGSLFGRKPAPAEHAWQGTHLVFSLEDANLAVSLMPAPIPWSQLEGPAATAWWWPDAAERMQAHTHHFIVALIGGAIAPVERRVVLTKVTSAVVSHTDAVGVYWGEGTLVHEPSEFVRQAASVNPQEIPGPLWLDVRVEQNPDGSYRCFTTGMAPLGFLEIEVAKSTLAGEDLLEFIGNTACYIVNGRLQIPDGDTLGRSATEQYKVRHGKSMFDRPAVLQVMMD
jgi:hypothetical protein